MIENELEISINDSLASAMADFSSGAELTPELLQSRRDRIMQLQEAMCKLPESFGMDKINEGNIRHFFATGVYGRELFIPKGSVIVSKIHRNKTFNVIASGVISVICPTNGFNTYEGPFCFVSEPLTKRIVIAHEDTLWITSHGYNGSEDLIEVENEIIAKDFEDTKSLKGESL